jgi:hypothetical protein
MIQEFVEVSTFLTQDLLPAYNSKRGQQIYGSTVDLLRSKFPFYVKELEGIADGSEVPFHKVKTSKSN